jgi:hypothetical protein
MSSNTALSAIDPHTYGLRAAEACTPIIDQILTSTDPQDLIKSITFINENIPHRDDRDRATHALINYAATGDRDAAAKIITGYEYVQAHLHLGKAMHALSIRMAYIDEIDQQPEYQTAQLDEMPIYPQPADDYEPAIASIIEILTETIQASNAPSAAISAATISI